MSEWEDMTQIERLIAKLADEMTEELASDWVLEIEAEIRADQDQKTRQTVHDDLVRKANEVHETYGDAAHALALFQAATIALEF